MTIRLSNAARAAIKTALRGKVTGLNTMTKADLLEACKAHGLNAAALAAQADIDAASNPATETAAAALQDAPAEQEAETASDAPRLSPDVQADIDAINTAWREMDYGTYSARLTALAIAAHKPAERIVETVTEYVSAPGDAAKTVAPVAAKPALVQAKRTGHKTAKDLFGSAAPGALGSIKLATWDSPHAPAIDPDYVWPAGTGAVISQMFKRHRPVMLWGPAGTGKTSFAKQLAAHLGRPFIRISCNAQTDGPTLTGMTAPAAGGGVEWRDGQLTAAMRTAGALVLIDEFTAARPGAMYVMQSVLDDRELHVEETGEVIKVADGVLFIVADNTNGSGDTTGQYGVTSEMTEAQRDRVGISIRVDYLPEDVEAKVLAAKTGCTPELAKLLVGYANATRQKAQAGDIAAGIGMRRLLSWAEMLMDGVQPSDAAQGAFLDRMAPERAEALAQLLVTHCNATQVRAALKGETTAPVDPSTVNTSTGFSPIND